VSTPPPSVGTMLGQTVTSEKVVKVEVTTSVVGVVVVVWSVTGMSDVLMIVVVTTSVVAGVVAVRMTSFTTVDLTVSIVVVVVAFTVVVRVARAEEQAVEIKLNPQPRRGSGRRMLFPELRSIKVSGEASRFARLVGGVKGSVVVITSRNGTVSVVRIVRVLVNDSVVLVTYTVDVEVTGVVVYVVPEVRVVVVVVVVDVRMDE